MGNRKIKKHFKFKIDMLYDVQGSIYTFFWLQSPPEYLKEYSSLIMKFMIDMRRNGKKEDKKAY